MDWKDNTGYEYTRIKACNLNGEYIPDWKEIKETYEKQGWKFQGVDHTEHAIFARLISSSDHKEEE